MPHAENETMSEKPLTNGDKPSSQFLSHLHSYPVVSDTVSVYKSHPWGAQSLDLANSTYETSWPYLKGPFSYVAPYVAKIDELADTGLSKVDSTFPQVKTPTDDIKAGILSYVHYPGALYGQGKEYIFTTWDDEYKKTGEDKSIVHYVKAIISTELKVAGDALAFAKDFLQKVGKEVKTKADGVTNSQVQGHTQESKESSREVVGRSSEDWSRDVEDRLEEITDIVEQNWGKGGTIEEEKPFANALGRVPSRGDRLQVLPGKRTIRFSPIASKSQR